MGASTSQYSLIAYQWPELHAEAVRVEQCALSDPRTACFYARRTVELLVQWVYDNDSQLQRPFGYGTLADLISSWDFREIAGDQIRRFQVIKDLGNKAVHRADPIRTGDAVLAAGELFQVLRWLVLTYGRDPEQVRGQRFEPGRLPSKASAAAAQQSQTREQLEALAEQLAERDQQLRDQRLASIASQEEVERLRAEVTALRKANLAATQPEEDLPELATRQAYIDHYLEEAGWRLGDGCTHEEEVQGMPNETGQGFVDYVLWGDDGKPLALVEAKRTSRNPMEGQRQGELYANCLEKRYGQRPLIFLSNGYRHRLWDDLRYPPRDVQGFYKKEEIVTLIRRREIRKHLANATLSRIADRYYQQQAIRAIGESLERGRRKTLLVQATGTGKTRTAISLTELLYSCNWIKRVLFLADRTSLVLQAERAFRMLLPDCSPVNLVTNKGGEGRVFLSTYPTMMNLIDAEDGHGIRRFGVGHFDLIIIDEAHRSVYQKYGAIFSYFDSLLAGLTATPRDEIDRNTYQLFDLEVGMPTDEYGLDQAVADRFLVSFKPISVSLKFPREGIRYTDLSVEEQAQWDLLDWDEDVQQSGLVESGALNNWLFNANTVDQGLKVLMTQGCPRGNGDGIGKTVIFARNHRHAQFIQERFDHNYPHLAGKIARVIDNQVSYAQSLIDEFADPKSDLMIAISVDMLDTGIDVPEIVNLVFFKPVRSRTKFWQMVGRGTRLCPGLFGPGQDKQNFWIFDFCENLEFFMGKGGAEGAAPPATLSTRLFRARLALVQAIDQQHQDGIEPPTELVSHREAMSELLRCHVAACPADNFLVRPHLEKVERFAQVEAWQQLTPEDHEWLESTLASLPSAHSEQIGDTDAVARRFDLLIYSLQLAHLRSEPRFAKLQSQVRGLADLLEERYSIPMVAAELELIQNLQCDEWWQDITLLMLENVRRRLRGLVGLIETTSQQPLYSDFSDDVVEIKELDGTKLLTNDAFRQFRIRAQDFLRAHEDHLTMQRLRRNQPLTTSDLEELEHYLLSHGIGDQHVIERAREVCKGFGNFVRSLVGLDRNAAKELFADYLAEGTHTVTQIRFINAIIDELTSKGAMSAARLYEPPFSDLAPTGPESLFSAEEAEKIFDLLTWIERRAQPVRAA
jgi:type I restriction enzyme R subunit